jgi:hypothetical protein
MITLPELAADVFGKFLANYMTPRYESWEARLVAAVPAAARLALEYIGNSDALYHDVEHTMLVALAGHDIMRGRALQTQMSAGDYAHFIIACLFHDIGYVRGLLAGDDDDGFVADRSGRKVKLARGASDAALLPYHVDGSKLFIMERLRNLELFDAARIANAVEGSRRPTDMATEDGQSNEEADLLRAADLIGQLGDPNYICKANALYYEFEEAGLNRQLGYDNTAGTCRRDPQGSADESAGCQSGPMKKSRN